MSNLQEKTANHSDVFVFGCGNVGQFIYKQLMDERIQATVRFCDNYQHISDIPGVEVLKPENAYHEYPDALFIVGSIIHFAPMYKQLKGIGIPEENIVAEWIETRSRLTVRESISVLPYHLVEHCNLKCAGCLHFSNIAEEQFADLDEFKKVFGRFIHILGSSYHGGIQFFGGEPLLHPQIEHFIITAGELLTDRGWINIISNGILLAKMPKSFWETCARYEAEIGLSGYPIDIDIPEIQKLAEVYDVRVWISSRDERAWSQYVLDLDGNQEIKRSFTLCENANERFILKGRHLYPCSVTACIEHFNKAFGRELALCSEDYLDILSDITAQDILNFVATPVPFCRYCNRDKLKLGERWRPSTCDISEYLE